jgi:hypothetical protein
MLEMKKTAINVREVLLLVPNFVIPGTVYDEPNWSGVSTHNTLPRGARGIAVPFLVSVPPRAFD